ncbi:MAG TPA: hypothetical protein P5137_13210 [Candidatus Brocadiia bacterium]|nr:hypothetical protein [Candidatus Brocadiia bacterium]
MFSDDDPVVRAYAQARIRECRRSKASRMPAWLAERRASYRDRLEAMARQSFEETGIWFLSRGASRQKDEQETYAVWGDLLFFRKMEELPYYSEENLRKAVEFWRSWQNLRTGRLYNPFYQDPQHPEVLRQSPGNRTDYSADTINNKYIVNILAKLGSELPMPCNWHSHADAGVDTFDQIWDALAQWSSAHGGAFPVSAAFELDAGKLDKIPQVEAGMAALVRAYSAETGMWRPEPLAGFPWRDYTPSAGFKVISRICGYVGMENYPLAKLKTAVDNLLAHRAELYEHPAMARNYGEIFAHHIAISDYRCEEQLDAMEECLQGFYKPAWWENTGDACYCVFGSALIGGFMNWEDFDFEQAFAEWTRFAHGCNLKWRFVACPFGNWVNALPKEPEAVAGPSGHDAARYGLKARNRAHWAKKVREILPQQEARVRADAAGQGEAEWVFTLSERQAAELKAPYLKAAWSGAYDVSLNGEAVKQVRYNLPDLPVGWLVPDKAARTLRPGANRVTARLVGPGKEPRPGAPLSTAKPFLRLGLISWH